MGFENVFFRKGKQSQKNGIFKPKYPIVPVVLIFVAAVFISPSWQNSAIFPRRNYFSSRAETSLLQVIRRLGL